MWADPNVVRYIGGKPSTESQTWMRILSYAGLWALLRFGYWAIEEKGGATFVGEGGFADFHRDIDPAMRAPEIGWAFATAFHGKGYATEAVRAIAAWGDRHLAQRRTVCLIAPENAASVRVAETCGYRRFSAGTLLGTAVDFYERAGNMS